LGAGLTGGWGGGSWCRNKGLAGCCWGPRGRRKKNTKGLKRPSMTTTHLRYGALRGGETGGSEGEKMKES